MLLYRFAMRLDRIVDDLGSLGLRGDDEAVDFGKQFIRDLKRQYADEYSGWNLHISERGRTVGHLTVD
jgi:hypothetical protein